MPAAGNQRRDTDLAEPGGDIPVAQPPGDRAELARAPHGLVYVAVHPGECALHALPPRVQPAQMPPVELGDGPLVLGAGEILARLVAVEHVADRFVQAGPKLRAVGD